jgi:integrase
MESPQPDYVALFEQSLLASGKSESTIIFYRMKIREYLKSIGDNDPFTRMSVERYLAMLRIRGDSTATTRNRFFILKSFFRAMGFIERWTFGKTDAPQLPAVQTRPVFSSSDMLKLEDVARRSGSLRDYAVIRLADAIGIRRCEIASLKLTDLHLHPIDEYTDEALASLNPQQLAVLKQYFIPHIHITTSKHGNRVQREIDFETARALAEYVRSRLRKRRVGGSLIRGDPNALFIAGRNGRRVSVGTLSRVLRRIRVEAGIQKPRGGFHASRRGRINELYSSGVGRNELAAEWGWRNVSTIDHYIVPDKEQVKQDIRRVHPYFKK